MQPWKLKLSHALQSHPVAPFKEADNAPGSGPTDSKQGEAVIAVRRFSAREHRGVEGVYQKPLWECISALSSRRLLSGETTGQSRVWSSWQPRVRIQAFPAVARGQSLLRELGSRKLHVLPSERLTGLNKQSRVSPKSL